ncbi:MAG: neutral zinc metallopeptidase [Kofleriaceae bacterium]|nr:neutral zinc metallopeptidase [Kofleriaceae bacterium]
MKWTRGTKNDDVIDARGKQATGVKVAGGGIVTVLVVYAVAKIFGVDISGLVGSGGGGNESSTAQQHENEPPKGPDPDAELVDYVRFVMKDIQDTFESIYKADGKTYDRAKLIVFTNAVDTKCGRSTSAIGPFYCPGDANAYIDLSFYKDLKARFGAPGDFAQAYVLAHEIGHHLQNLMRVEQKQRGRRDNDLSVRIELQADCFAGVWGHHAKGKKLLEAGDLEEALTAATAIGDDRLQRQAGQEVNPETFTHGTSAQRVTWFRVGFDSGKLDSCDTFSIAQP